MQIHFIRKRGINFREGTKIFDILSRIFMIIDNTFGTIFFIMNRIFIKNYNGGLVLCNFVKLGCSSVCSKVYRVFGLLLLLLSSLFFIHKLPSLAFPLLGYLMCFPMAEIVDRWILDPEGFRLGFAKTEGFLVGK